MFSALVAWFIPSSIIYFPTFRLELVMWLFPSSITYSPIFRLEFENTAPTLFCRFALILLFFFSSFYNLWKIL